MSLDRRLAKLEDELAVEEDGPPLEQCLREALEEAMERAKLRPQGGELPDEVPGVEGPFAERLKQARQRAAEARRQAGS